MMNENPNRRWTDKLDADSLLGAHAEPTREHVVALAQLNQELGQRVAEKSGLLLESEMRYRLLVSETKDYAIYFLDPTGHITTWNMGAERIKGYAAEEV